MISQTEFHVDNLFSVLCWLRKDDDVSADMADMRREFEEESREERITVVQLFKQRSLRKPLLISIVMQLSQQLSGINAVSGDNM